MNSLAKQALKDVKESTEHFKKTLATQGMTLDDWLEKMRIKSEETRKRAMKKAKDAFIHKAALFRVSCLQNLSEKKLEMEIIR